jgi:hypothetical protein
MAGGLGRLKKNFIVFTIKVAIRDATIPDQTRSGLFLMKRSMNTQAVSESPRKVRLAQINELEYTAKVLICMKRA